MELLTVTFLALISLHSAYSLQCYNCSSLMDEKCGEDWKLSGEEAEKYEVKCPVNATHCYKRITIPKHQAKATFRGCWLPWENYTITRKQECTEIGKETEVCICADSKKPCNRENILSASIPEILVGTLVSFISIFY